ncbi:cyclic nucleotide-binding domain-containing protein [Methylobacterium nonmethylotrophicum]|uniref:Cyclic nucleotide-binding domain-containing protein n=1 Tax=Methylobacterium nonmethylotrophicum TaxID=1141884 RepID=A0A4Z0NMW5_9HYPH|nr:cyclic nucleotide-binding domain-containing protein [Methylobacterium nonmethylotrophicum]TGD97737.1 cyclic nucleotide-binding domain-containing protein [Methylobacterium nonmethylotrophicum]
MTNLSGPDRSHGVTLRVRLAPSVRPALVVETMRDVLLSSTLILKSPPPSAQVASLDAQAIEIELGFHVADRSGASPARTEILDLVYRHAKAARLDLAPPPGTGVLPSRRASRPLPPRRASSLRLLDNLPLFAVLTEPEKQALAAAMDRRSYRESEVVAAQGTVLERLVLVRSGVLSVTCRDPDDGDEHELERLAPGDCFGERGILLGLEETGTVRALGRVVTYEIGRDILAPLMRGRPAMAEELEVILSRQSEAERRLAGSRNAGPLPPTTPGLAGRIRSLLGLPHDPPARTP